MKQHHYKDDQFRTGQVIDCASRMGESHIWKRGLLFGLPLFAVLGFLSPSFADAPKLGNLKGQLSINERPAKNGVVYLLPEEKRLTMDGMQVVIRQKNLKFSPDFFVITVGSTVSFENRDDKIHNIRSRSKSNPFDTGAHLPGTEPKKIKFKQAGLVEIECSVHLDMRAVLFVSPSPLASVTDADGSFEVGAIPFGGYQLKVWHEGLSESEAEKGSRRIKVSKDSEALTLVLSSASGLNQDNSQTRAEDWTGVMREIEVALDSALVRWQKNKKTSAATRLMTVQSRLYSASGLKEQITALRGEARAAAHDDRMNIIRKMVQGVSKMKPNARQIQTEMDTLMSGLRDDLSLAKGRK